MEQNVRTRSLSLFILIVLFFANGLRAQPPVHTGRFSPFIDNNINGFWEYLPRNYDVDVNVKYPLLVFIHGAGEQGDDQSATTLNKILRAGPPRLINSGNFPDSFFVGGQWHKFIVLSPQIKNGIVGVSSIVQPSTIEAVIQYARSAYRIDTTRIYLCGLSMGGGATWDYAGSSATAASKLAAIIVATGAADLTTSQANNIAQANLPILTTHNRDDNIIDVSRTEANIAAIQSYSPAINPAPHPVYWDLGGHNVWRRTYEDILPGATPNGNLRDTLGINVYEWMLQNFRPAVILPVTWRSFVVRSQNGRTVLQWTVSNQASTKEYVIEKSRDGLQWSVVTSMIANHWSNPQTYTFADGIVMPGVTYYRIKQLETDGRFSYSAIKQLDLSATGKWLVYPNPFLNEIKIDANLPAGNLVIRLTDATGRTVASRKQETGVMNEIVLDGLGRLPGGTYFLAIEDMQGRIIWRERVVKRN